MLVYQDLHVKSGDKHILMNAEHANRMLRYFENTRRMMLNLIWMHLLSDDLNHAEPRSACDPDQGEGAYLMHLTMGEIGLVLGVGDVCWCTRKGL